LCAAHGGKKARPDGGHDAEVFPEDRGGAGKRWRGAIAAPVSGHVTTTVFVVGPLRLGAGKACCLSAGGSRSAQGQGAHPACPWRWSVRAFGSEGKEGA